MNEPHKYKRSEIEQLLGNCIGKRLEEVDTKHVLSGGKRNKGYAGAVIEQSVLGYPADNARRPDLLVDGVPTELKTTGLIRSKKQGTPYEAKEPVSITAVRPDDIVHEEFETSEFWEKTEHILFVYYLYTHKASSPAEYRDFPIKDYQFKDFSGKDREYLEHDWTIVRDFIRKIHAEHPEDPQSQYPRISSDLNRQQLTVIDTAPKWPNNPRFRLKRGFVSAVVNEYYGSRYDELPQSYSSFEELDSICHRLTGEYSGHSIEELFGLLGLPQNKTISKQDAESIIVRMFGGTATKMSKVSQFARSAVVGKSIVLTTTGARTEDMKLGRIDFDELQDPNRTFEESAFRSGFSEPTVLCIVFEEPSHDAPFRDNIFRGFKRFYFTEEFIEKEVRPVWDQMRHLILDGELRFIPQSTKNGSLRHNGNGELRGAPNWPKSKDGIIFLRGSGRNSDPKHKTVTINGISMYPQNLWIKGTYMADKLRRQPYL